MGIVTHASYITIWQNVGSYGDMLFLYRDMLCVFATRTHIALCPYTTDIYIIRSTYTVLWPGRNAGGSLKMAGSFPLPLVSSFPLKPLSITIPITLSPKHTHIYIYLYSIHYILYIYIYLYAHAWPVMALYKHPGSYMDEKRRGARDCQNL